MQNVVLFFFSKQNSDLFKLILLIFTVVLWFFDSFVPDVISSHAQ